MKNNLYNFILNENKELIELANEVIDKKEDFNITSFNHLNNYNKDLLFKIKEESEFYNLFLNESNFLFWRSYDFKQVVFEIKLNDLVIEINKETYENEIKKYITFTYKDFGINLDYFIYNINFDKINSVKNKIKLSNENKKIILDENDDFWLNLFNKEENNNLTYIKELIFENDIDLHEIFTGNIEYKNKLEYLFELEMIKKDSTDLKNFINHEKVFSVLNVNDFIVKRN